jgi:hypothetical protein
MQPKANGNRQPKWKLDHIERFAHLRSAHRIAREVNLSAPFVYQYCELKGIKLLKRDYETREPVLHVPHERFIRFKEEKKVFVRPKAVYDNPNWQDRINELIEMKIV